MLIVRLQSIPESIRPIPSNGCAILQVRTLGPDGVPGTDDDDLCLQAGSPCIDAGDNTALPLDDFDLDGDGDTNELLPVDFNGNPRVVNDPATRNTGFPPGPRHVPMVDMGAFEFQPLPVAGIGNGEGIVNAFDLLFILNLMGVWRDVANCPANIAPPGAPHSEGDESRMRSGIP